ncbi:hypothetical protein [Luteipulveratus halotolerans]|uniref:DUF559 domain-containing protein n=1 Tax=Luteipulveratus halotolerans TaxID=1631356 RepID=A0A0L6CFK8_9MICO|nr:hypothetical protein [Luteipulveratus halotolerans]KNX36323.1 hypothetical protein VV01_02905 [Luteipulveratus halotolerans]
MPDRSARQRIAAPLARRQGGVVSRAQLEALGITRSEIKVELAAGRWHARGRHAVAVHEVTRDGLFAAALMEVRGDVRLDGVSALIYRGLTGWDEDLIHVSVRHGTHAPPVAGTSIHRVRDLEPCAIGVGLATSHPTYAAIRAAVWARSDRAAMTILAIAVQQEVVAADALLERWRRWKRRIPRRALIDQVIRDVCAGAQSLGELDFARLCRERGLPEPDRQVVTKGPKGRIFLDVRWSTLGVVVEIDGAHHASGLMPVDDALRQNQVVLGGDVVLRIPVLGLRLEPDGFMNQVAQALTTAAERLAS